MKRALAFGLAALTTVTMFGCRAKNTTTKTRVVRYPSSVSETTTVKKTPVTVRPNVRSTTNGTGNTNGVRTQVVPGRNLPNVSGNTGTTQTRRRSATRPNVVRDRINGNLGRRSTFPRVIAPKTTLTPYAGNQAIG